MGIESEVSEWGMMSFHIHVVGLVYKRIRYSKYQYKRKQVRILASSFFNSTGIMLKMVE
jgi:hypothetical protein